MNHLLRTIATSDNLYGRFLNTLSLMEYTGARKIVKSQQQNFLNKRILEHMAEEMRHALTLKKAALRVAPKLCETYESEALLCGTEAYHYFQTVDHLAKNELSEQDPWHCYLYTTFLIEVRVLIFYAAFEKILLELGKPLVFRGILAEEKKHLEEVSRWLSVIPNYENNIARLKAIEEEAFDNFLSAIEEQIKPLDAQERLSRLHF